MLGTVTRKAPLFSLVHFRKIRLNGNERNYTITTTESPNECEGQVPVVYTDGACTNNGKRNAKAGYGIFWGDHHPDNISQALSPSERQTSNRAEYVAVMWAIKQAIAKELPKIVILTDSELLALSLNKWVSTWKTNGWKTTKRTPVANRDLLEKIDNMRSQIEVEIKHIPGHSGIPGNEQANKLAIDALSN